MAWISGRTLSPSSGELVFTIGPDAQLPAAQDWVQLWEVCPGIEPIPTGVVLEYTDLVNALAREQDGLTLRLESAVSLVCRPGVPRSVSREGRVPDPSKCQAYRRVVRIEFVSFEVTDNGESVVQTKGCAGVNCDTIAIYLRTRGTNPSRAAVSAALGGDMLRAICWRESTWRQFGANGKPLVNTNSNGTADWGLMQINQATPEQRWNWKANVNRGAALLAEKRTHANAYLSKHPPVTAEMLENETLQRYNGGTYYKWNESTSTWDVAPPNGYVAAIRQLMASKPWSRRVSSRARSMASAR